MYLGFFPWYRAMQLAGVARISQLQYLQPFAAIAYAVVLLGERVDTIDIALVLGVVGAIIWGRRR
jgi:drug/metabolite transporter (DMT)-like permease